MKKVALKLKMLIYILFAISSEIEINSKEKPYLPGLHKDESMRFIWDVVASTTILLHLIESKRVNKYATTLLSCSEAAFLGQSVSTLSSNIILGLLLLASVNKFFKRNSVSP